MKKIIAILAVIALMVTVGFVATGKKLPSIGYVLVGPHTDGGWSMRHHQGFQSLTKHGYKVGMVEMVPEAESTKIFLKLARKHDIVFATSFGYMDGMAKAAEKSPDTIFLHATGFKGNDTNFD
jgi:basic membrane lipoprotein Med (substrate-binding protein (PBP1-ABC) superfamily)